MAKVKIEDVVYHLDAEFKRALDDTMAQFAPNVRYDRDELFRFFLGRVYSHCGVWENVPDNCVEGYRRVVHIWPPTSRESARKQTPA
jgi:hypothetical protein